MRRKVNQNTQPFVRMPVFQNWEVVAEGWYFACPSDQLPKGKARSMAVCGQHLVLFRGGDGMVRALDGFCPHMGTDLGIGTVRGNHLACFFHHWEFDGRGFCQRIPCGENPPSTAQLQAYAVEEKYSAIWVFPAAEADMPVPDFPAFEGGELRCLVGRSYMRSCHHHVTMINGIDVQHLRSVHGFDIEVSLTISEASHGMIDYSIQGNLPRRTLKDKVVVWLFGDAYGYSMRYAAGTTGLLTMAEGVNFLGRFSLPTLHMIFAYRPERFGETTVQPIYVSRRRKGVRGWCLDWFLIWLTRRFFLSLRDEDGKVYDHMRFNPVSLLDIDEPVRFFIDKINHLKPSIWSRKTDSDPLATAKVQS